MVVGVVVVGRGVAVVVVVLVVDGPCVLAVVVVVVGTGTAPGTTVGREYVTLEIESKVTNIRLNFIFS